MTNPVFDRMNKGWSVGQVETTPAGYPTMPGYTVGTKETLHNQSSQTSAERGTYARNPYEHYDTSVGYTTTSQWDQDAMESAFAAPSADAVDRGIMTWDDVLVRTGISFGVLLAAAVVAWWATLTTPTMGLGLMMVGFLGGLILSMVNIFSRKIRPAFILAYAVCEGAALGALSCVMEMTYPGIVAQAFVATLTVVGVTLALFASGKVRNSPRFARFTLIALVSLLVFRLLYALLSAFGWVSSSMVNATVYGFPVSAIVGVLAVLIGAACLIQDFDQAKVGVERGAPANFAWICAFGFMVTIVWMYLEILQLLARLRD
ncbi:Bax inhibitor-1/YccA family protein [Schaalia sp. lx-260]|uniref:Bax inhibitor-1/YccA family protein n=1 Tax=Schaalia sp. lx-260 TaxID=2899082 RepID=UPI001E2834E5|nr:Bax inhibitor-1/YccA family protein [Schaalia sp. lx-260]MCD4550264.1 Bax inhibitor-1/YccA family protein [Schaalia sp. lx-260]